jgi:signal transduction histidine kinase
MTDINLDLLRNLPLFSGLSDENLRWLVEKGERVTLPAGEVLMAEGSLPDAFYVVLDGDFEVSKRANNQVVVLAMRGAGEMMGEISLIEDSARTATVRALTEGHLLRISREMFRDLLCNNVTTALAILRTVMSRLRNTEAMLGQSEKLASLGTLAAGLAHELNNPAAAARRGAEQLRSAIGNWLRARGALDTLHLDADASEVVVRRLRDDTAHEDVAHRSIDPLTRSDREAALEEVLQDLALENVWDYTPALVTYGWDAAALHSWLVQFEQQERPVIARWLATGYLVHSLIAEVNESTSRVSDIVKAVKSYTYLDQAPIQEIEVTEGIENTLIILKHKLRNGVAVKRDYAPDLPRIEAFASELNQVWTNIIDNAIDALAAGGGGVITLATRANKSGGNDEIAVEISDDGPGIPAQALPRIFEAFYTTKGTKGTGLGLHISYNIVRKHGGRIAVESQPGGTRFTVLLPVKLTRRA